ncbi:hypothetical protein KA005_51685, partial [bacterium]|nr:hypothetical protein [bacterium]
NAEDMTDEEIQEASDYPRYDGNGYSDGQWYAENPDEVAKDDGAGYHNSQMIAENADEVIAAQQVFQDENGDVIILDDNGDIIILENPSRKGVRVG